MTIHGPYTSGLAAGVAGSATANSDTPVVIRGRLNTVYLEYTIACIDTVDVIIKTSGNTTPSYTLLTLTDLEEGGNFLPRAVPHSTLGVALAALTVAEKWPVFDNLNIKIDQANSGDYVTAWFLVDE